MSRGGKKHFARGGYKGRGGGGRDRWEGHMKDSSQDNREDFKVHEGSIKLETVQASPEWARRIVLPEGTPKRKYAICFGYTGTNYQGLQINPDAMTIEAVLEKALFLAGGIIEQNFGNIQKISWSRTARTDKGVHALTQCCSMKLCFPLGSEEAFRDTVNSFLPDDIRVHYIQKVGKSFNAKLHCTHRRYQYLLPTYLLQASEITLNLLQDAFDVQGPIPNAARTGGYAEPGSNMFLSSDSLAQVREAIRLFRCPPEALEKLRKGLKMYEGTRSYHNFTSNKDPNDASAKRFITSSTCSDPFIDSNGNVEWVCISISGQSFLLNQIRKMVHLTLEYTRGNVLLEKFDEAFSAANKVEIPMVPGMGLYLDELFFDLYNNRLETLAEQHERSLANKAQRRVESEASDVGVNLTAEDELDIQQSSKKQKIEISDSNEGDDDKVLHLPLIWGKLPELQDRLQSFKTDSIWAHIFLEEKNSLGFLYYVDFLRVLSPLYAVIPSKSLSRSDEAKKEKNVDNSGD
jgi:tRNA pseudouridine38-40 synthase